MIIPQHQAVEENYSTFVFTNTALASVFWWDVATSRSRLPPTSTFIYWPRRHCKAPSISRVLSVGRRVESSSCFMGVHADAPSSAHSALTGLALSGWRSPQWTQTRFPLRHQCIEEHRTSSSESYEFLQSITYSLLLCKRLYRPTSLLQLS